MNKERSPQWRDGKFRNVHERIDGPLFTMLRKFFFGGSKYRKPNAPVSTEARRSADYAEPPSSGLRVTWLGHSTLGPKGRHDVAWSPMLTIRGVIATANCTCNC